MVGLVARQVGEVTRARSKTTVPAFSIWTVSVHLVPLLAAFPVRGYDWCSVGWVEHRAVRVEWLDRVVHVALLPATSQSAATQHAAQHTAQQRCQPRQQHTDTSTAISQHATRSSLTHLCRLAAVPHLSDPSVQLCCVVRSLSREHLLVPIRDVLLVPVPVRTILVA